MHEGFVNIEPVVTTQFRRLFCKCSLLLQSLTEKTNNDLKKNNVQKFILKFNTHKNISVREKLTRKYIKQCHLPICMCDNDKDFICLIKIVIHNY